MVIFKLYYRAIFFEHKGHASDSAFRHDINPYPTNVENRVSS